jgi:hypothetical protein
MSTFPENFVAGGTERLVGYIEFPDQQPAVTASAAYLTVGSAAPSPLTTFVTPLVFDDTATTGGLYAWTGTTYSKVGLATT